MVFIADFNGGGRSDIAVLVVPGAGPAFLSVLLGQGDGTFSAPNTFGEFDTLKVDLQPRRPATWMAMAGPIWWSPTATAWPSS